MPWSGRNSTPVRPTAGNEQGGLCSRIADKSYKEPPGPNEYLLSQQIDLKDSMNHCVPNWDIENGMMQSSDFLSMAKANWDNVQPPKRSMMLEHDIEELLWENGQVVNKVVKRPLPTQLSKTLQNDDAVLPGKPSPVGKDNTLELVVHDMSAANASSIHEDVMDSWLHYPLDDSLEKEYCSDFFGGMPSTNVHMLRDTLSGQMNNAPAEKVSNLHVQKESSLSSESNSAPWTGVFAGMVNTTNAAGPSKTGKESPSKLISSDKAMALGAGRASGAIPQSVTDAFVKVRTVSQLPVSKWHTDVQDSSRSKDDHLPCKKTATQVSVSPLSMPPPKIQATDLASMKPSRSKIVNFSHFSRPAATMKANLQNIGSASGLSTSGIQNRLDKIRMDGNAAAEPSIIESNSTGMTTIGSSSGANSRAQDLGSCQTHQNPPSGKNLDVATCSEDVTDSSAKASEQGVCQNSNAGRSLASCGTEKCGDAGDGPEPTITSSSGGSGYSAGRVGKEATNTSKRKGRDVEDSECQSEDVEYESADTKKQCPSRTTTSLLRPATVPMKMKTNPSLMLRTATWILKLRGLLQRGLGKGPVRARTCRQRIPVFVGFHPIKYCPGSHHIGPGRGIPIWKVAKMIMILSWKRGSRGGRCPAGGRRGRGKNFLIHQMTMIQLLPILTTAIGRTGSRAGRGGELGVCRTVTAVVFQRVRRGGAGSMKRGIENMTGAEITAPRRRKRNRALNMNEGIISITRTINMAGNIVLEIRP